MFLRIENISPKKFIGISLEMSLVNNKTFELWHQFMPRKKEINNPVNGFLFSMQVYGKNYNPADMEAIFEKRALIEVSHFENVPHGMQTFVLPSGKYAIFLHKGLPSLGAKTFRYVFGTWLPNSEYRLDHRPHFEILGEKYKNNDPSSEEEIWIPIKPK